MNRSKAPLTLIGQILMVLFFALTAAICLQAFAKSETISQKSADRDAAMLLAQNAAETIKSVHGDLKMVCIKKGGNMVDGVWQYSGNKHGQITTDGVYHVQVRRLESDQLGLGRAQIRVTDMGETELFSLMCSWQEDLG